MRTDVLAELGLGTRLRSVTQQIRNGTAKKVSAELNSISGTVPMTSSK